ncbi:MULTISPECIES: ComF family protein [unclassified Pseudomonas]|uniref:ComF family protein n=1 Tax=unclassified Pseudomonas TaxID=196821 RepID=UPI000D384D25|nr:MULTISPECIES: ComF family protein [unclassified Pseudomonas]RAU46231.1 ComF family protein [Pseudomonas sp. RIT 409]RAU53723.1 ComF family protein [Pseudomonas sp. RIT 412]
MRCQPHEGGQVYIWLKNVQTCLLCDERTDTPLPICTACESELPWLIDFCDHCALPMPMSGLTCAQCVRHPPAFSEVIVPWLYDFPIDALVTRFKHQGKWPLGRLLAELLSQTLRHRFDEDLERPELLMPVPLADGRLRQRGYNQAAMIANWLGSVMNLDVDETLVKRIKDTPAQQSLNAKARRRNLRDAFVLPMPAKVSGKHIALIDDVMTTGSTADTLARLLRQAGAKRVDLYCLARTAKPGQ